MTTILELLDETVDELTKPIPYKWVTDHGTTVHKSMPCLLDQLRGAVENPGNYKTGGNAKSYPNQLNISALDLEEDIKAIVGRYYRQYRRQGENLTSVKEQLRSWVANMRSYGQDDIVETYRLTNGWRNRVLELFNPHTVEIDASCPQCNMRYSEQVEAGEKTRARALKANHDSVICTACGIRASLSNCEKR